MYYLSAVACEAGAIFAPSENLLTLLAKCASDVLQNLARRGQLSTRRRAINNQLQLLQQRVGEAIIAVWTASDRIIMDEFNFRQCVLFARQLLFG